MNRTFALLAILLTLIVAIVCGLNLGTEARNAWGAYLTGCATLIIAVTAALAGYQAVQEYSARVAADKAKWLFDLYEKLFEDHRYKDVRRRLDYDDTAEIRALIVKDETKQDFALAEQVEFDQFTDYLNFFEMIAHLKEAGQLTSADVGATFDYYLRLLTKQRNPQIRQYLRKTGFESLDRLLLEYDAQERNGASQSSAPAERPSTPVS
jgi:hypothetical protein